MSNNIIKLIIFQLIYIIMHVIVS